MPNHFLRAHLLEVPMHRVILRSVEAKLFARLTLQRPILDVGCGDGHFASVVFPQPLDVGFDPAEARVVEAMRRRAYRLAVVADGGAIPCRDGSFPTVISNCVIEHIPHMERVLVEVHRVLRPGGQFVFSVPSEHFADFLFWSSLFAKLRLHSLSEWYGRTFNRISYHYHCYSPAVWHEKLERVGFRVEHWEYYISERTMHAFDLSHYFSVPSLVTRRLLGRWVLFPMKVDLLPLERWLRPFYDEDHLDRGAYLFFVCRKTGVGGQGSDV